MQKSNHSEYTYKCLFYSCMITILRIMYFKVSYNVSKHAFPRVQAYGISCVDYSYDSPVIVHTVRDL